ncbi:MAG: DUF484 family protein [Agarilytica sp.]
MTEQFNSEKHSVDARAVAEYLREHHDFFVQHPDVLAEIELPHDSGSAVSLVEKQVSILRERNMDMRHRLSSLLDNARENDVIFDKTKRLILALLESRTLSDFVDALYYSFEKEYGIHYTRIILFGSNGVEVGPARLDSVNNAKQSIGKHLKAIKSVAGGIDVKEIEYLFDDDAPNVGSAALTVLSHGNLIGVLAIGNQDPNHYNSSMGTLFLAYIGEILNRLLPRYIQN